MDIKCVFGSYLCYWFKENYMRVYKISKSICLHLRRDYVGTKYQTCANEKNNGTMYETGKNSEFNLQLIVSATASVLIWKLEIDFYKFQ